VFDQLHLPPWAGTFVTVLVIAGFPIAILLSWFLEFRDGRAVLDGVSPRDRRRRRFGRTYMSVISGLAVAAILVFLFDREFGLPVAHEPPVPASEPTAAPPVTDNSIAVLPFMNVDGSDKTRAFSNGLVDDVINRLARVPGLRVSSRGDSFTLEPNSPSDVVRRRLRVAMYIEGSVEIAGDAIRVTVQLINSADGFHIQSRTFNHPLKDFFHRPCALPCLIRSRPSRSSSRKRQILTLMFCIAAAWKSCTSPARLTRCRRRSGGWTPHLRSIRILRPPMRASVVRT
jgi:TolB-like protein